MTESTQVGKKLLVPYTTEQRGHEHGGEGERGCAATLEHLKRPYCKEVTSGQAAVPRANVSTQSVHGLHVQDTTAGKLRHTLFEAQPATVQAGRSVTRLGRHRGSRGLSGCGILSLVLPLLLSDAVNVAVVVAVAAAALVAEQTAELERANLASQIDGKGSAGILHGFTDFADEKGVSELCRCLPIAA
jgi:hypothetical protein